jgi:hypothetical protein
LIEFILPAGYRPDYPNQAIQDIAYAGDLGIVLCRLSLMPCC